MEKGLEKNSNSQHCTFNYLKELLAIGKDGNK